MYCALGETNELLCHAKDIMKRKYKYDKLPPSAKWPHIHDEDKWQFTEMNIRDKATEKHIKICAGGTSLHNFLKVAQGKRTCILFEGASGIGKSTLAFQIWRT